jgi:hypothetical protein
MCFSVLYSTAKNLKSNVESCIGDNRISKP